MYILSVEKASKLTRLSRCLALYFDILKMVLQCTYAMFLYSASRGFFLHANGFLNVKSHARRNTCPSVNVFEAVIRLFCLCTACNIYSHLPELCTAQNIGPHRCLFMTSVVQYFSIRELQILRRARQRVRDFLSTKKCARVNQRHFRGKTCRSGGSKLSDAIRRWLNFLQ